MRTLTQSLAVLLLLATTSARAQLAPLCESHLDEDKQAGFKAANSTPPILDDDALETGGATDDPLQIHNPGPNGYLQLQTNLRALDPEKISFPFDQRVSISYVFESAGASHALGYLYLKDAIAAGYVNAAGDLLDTNNNGILDLHEALYNLAPPEQPERYIGKLTAAGTPDRRCSVTFTDASGTKYSQPEIAMRSNCANTRQVFTTSNSNATAIYDARPGKTGTKLNTEVVGVSSNGSASSTDFSDKGLFPRIPNLLEPKDPANGEKGIGQMVFLLADDDSGADTYANLTPVEDTVASGPNGVPDYDVSKYDYRGIERAVNPNPGVSMQDRTVDLGEIKGGEEIVFFLIVYYDSDHSPGNTNNTTVYPCLKQVTTPGADQGKCLIHLRSPISVFFSKAAWNLDQNPVGGTIAARRNIGCGYSESCERENPNTNACKVTGTNEKLCGWLDNDALNRLRNEASYGNLNMPMEAVQVNRPGGYRNPMPHVIVGAPTTDPYRWILGFEDLPGGGDRDFNDVVFVINKQNGGTTRSGAMSGDISPSVADDFVITRVRFTREDDMVPPASRSCGSPPCWTEAQANACNRPGMPPPTINYYVAVDCKICSGSGASASCVKNPNPTWIPVEFPSPQDKTVELDMLALGFTGSQLCWRVNVTSPNDQCTPRIDNINVGYQAVKSGAYSRSSPSTVGNAILWGVNETPGKSWNGTNWPGDGQPSPAVRAYDNRKDYSLRGRLYFRSLYDPEVTNVTNVVERWDAGKVMALSFQSTDPLNRKLYTMTSAGARTTVKAEMDGPGNGNSPLFPDSFCDVNVGGKDVYDMNNDGRCGTPTITTPVSKNIPGETNDRTFLRDWLYGWEDRLAPGPANVKKPWAMGGINLSTVAVAVPPYLDSWAQNAQPAERDAYKKNFVDTLHDRETVAYVGTMNGFLHAFKSGAFRNEAVDDCASAPQLRGYFQRVGTSCTTPATPRDYGTGSEVFTYMPRLLLSRYVNSYIIHQSLANAPKPTMDASPTIANVDFGIPGEPKWKVSTPTNKQEGAKTVLVSASGRTSPAIYALDITNPADANYPMPLWEFNLARTDITSAFTNAAASNGNVLIPDVSGSRHAPSVARLNWDNSTDGVWTAVVGTDYKPLSSRSGTLYLLDMKTGEPLKKGNGAAGRYAGVITLEEGSGIAAETALVDLDQDGSYDTMYVPTTSGSVYRINVKSVNTSDTIGRQVKACKVASAPAVAATHPNAASNPAGTAWLQQIYSNLAVKVVREGATPKVRFYFGTADSPDEFGDGPTAAQRPNFRYHLMAFEDSQPDGSGACALLDPLWVKPLDPGQAVWGGVALSADKVYATTAVGTTADQCNLSVEDSGRYYEAPQLPDGTGAVAFTANQPLQGHGTSAPVVHDNHLFILTATGEMKMIGNDEWNNGAANVGATRSRVLVYDSVPDGRLPR
ncbi:DUF4114 domain-containing protein [Myxococcus stipitatus]|uniref:PilC/PilY family type IV pilus protein n=1 Tax=Myxococcus stipitatus TaxID=83455 RepID=UPI001F45C587|nr:PilC/PilY family type IV pilus protein [Myxococcus stipitatus]MCE9668877.1 DUF4114 domain-containing protein [Myxococcus stipitatus]